MWHAYVLMLCLLKCWWMAHRLLAWQQDNCVNALFPNVLRRRLKRLVRRVLFHNHFEFLCLLICFRSCSGLEVRKVACDKQMSHLHGHVIKSKLSVRTHWSKVLDYIFIKRHCAALDCYWQAKYSVKLKVLINIYVYFQVRPLTIQ